MLLMSMHAFVLKETEEMERRIVVLPVRDESLPLRALEEFAGRKAIVDALELLNNDAPCAHVEVTDFGRTLIAVGKTHGLAAAIEKAVRIFGADCVDDRGLGCCCGVAVCAVVHAPAVTDDKYYRSHG
jgi:hypothetical protein